MRLLKQLLVVAAIAFVGGQVVGVVRGNPWLTLAIGVGTAVLAILGYAWVVRRTERRPVTEVARAGAAGRLIRGTVIGVGMFVAVIVNLVFLGYYEINGLGSVPGAVALLGFMAAAAVTEELLFRGVLFRIVEERTGTWLALLLTGVVFGLVHLVNPDATLWGATAIAIEAGFMLAACYAATRNLWVPIGLHFGWNFAAGGIFSTVVSGNGESAGLLDATMSGPALITGGDFGPEGSPYAVGAGLVLTLVFMWLAHRRGHLVPCRRRRATAGSPVGSAGEPAAGSTATVSR
ncbi:CPBP family intramembrane glutamic endopeptidase [Micromonospora sp. HM5-17]|jgi:membrane protease YdiL (CAAX protease family)|uniref:CPBP family intramembrane glutamic endopeptidase n=1 Tax=Micromonospora sp. HM5-17 TaxID=2487710 RepID=UPI000F4793BE|nr:CPBP family intramembrane glutamic endopeptidase [Micromonospora sp. HM5-17]ROT33437.1 CPBP family intramembrane metalloprotease [Micromonospora sp. HM5-17]